MSDEAARVFEAIRAVSDFVDWDAASVSVSDEVSDTAVMGGSGVRRKSGRELLTIVLPYVRSKSFLDEQLAACDEEIASALELLEFLQSRKKALELENK